MVMHGYIIMHQLIMADVLGFNSQSPDFWGLYSLIPDADSLPPPPPPGGNNCEKHIRYILVFDIF